jgi:hypothetical protein
MPPTNAVQHVWSRPPGLLAGVVLLGLCGCDPPPEVVWLPDSSGFVYTDKGGTRLVQYDLAKRARRVVAEDRKTVCPRPAVSPDGKHFAVARLVRVSVAGSRDAALTVEVAIYDRDGREVRRSGAYEFTERRETPAAESATRAEPAGVVWAGHPDRLLTPWAMYDRLADRWVKLPGMPAVFEVRGCAPTEKGFLVASECKAEKDAVVVSFVDWDGWASEFKEPFKLKDLPGRGRAVKGEWDGRVWRYTLAAGGYQFDTRSLKHGSTPGVDKTWDALGGPAYFHQFAGSDLHLCAFSRTAAPDDGRVICSLELRTPTKQRRKVVYEEGEYTSIRPFPSPDGKRVAVWCTHPGDNGAIVTKADGSVGFVPRVPPVPPKNVIVVFDDAGEVVATVRPE